MNLANSGIWIEFRKIKIATIISKILGVRSNSEKLGTGTSELHLEKNQGLKLSCEKYEFFQKILGYKLISEFDSGTGIEF